MPLFAPRWVVPILALVSAACAPKPHLASLAPVRGVWVTEDEPYEDRSFELTREGELVLGQGGEIRETCRIQSVQVTERELGRFQFEVSYVDAAGVESLFPFDYYLYRDVVQFPGRKSVHWTRSKPQ